MTAITREYLDALDVRWRLGAPKPGQAGRDMRAVSAALRRVLDRVQEQIDHPQYDACDTLARQILRDLAGTQTDDGHTLDRMCRKCGEDHRSTHDLDAPAPSSPDRIEAVLAVIRQACLEDVSYRTQAERIVAALDAYDRGQP